MTSSDTPKTSKASPGVVRRVARGAGFMIAMRTCFRLLGVVSTLVLVRILAPQDFGIVAMATALCGVLDIMTATSFHILLVRHKQPERQHYDTAWTLSVLRGVLIGLLICAVSGPAAWFMDDGRLGELLRILALWPFLQGFENVGLIEYRRQIKFDLIFRYQVVGRVAGFLLTLGAALVLRNYWALVIGVIGGKLLTVPYSFALHPYRPCFSLAAWREFFDFSKWLIAANFLWLIDAYLMTLFLGRLVGAAGVGLYQVAYQIAALPASEIAAPVREPIYSGYAAVLGDRPALQRHVREGLAFLAMIIIPPSVGIALVSEPLTRILLGPSWDGAALIISICAFYALFDALGHFTHNIYFVLNQQGAFVRNYALLLAIRTPGVLLAGFFAGLVGASLAMAATGLFFMSWWFWRGLPLVGLSWRDAAAATIRTWFAAGVMAIGVLCLKSIVPPHDDALRASVLQLLVLSAGGVFVHVTAQYVLWRLAGKPSGPEERAILLARTHVMPRLAALR